MKIRILAIDDIRNANAFTETKRAIEGEYGEVYIHQINPIDFSSGHSRDNFLKEVQERASEFWDVVLVDINLDANSEPSSAIHLSLQIIAIIRAMNRAAILMLYSGTLSKTLLKVIENDKTSKLKTSEELLRKLLDAEIDRFISRDDLPNEVYTALGTPPLCLLADRFLMKHERLFAKTTNSGLDGKSFRELAESVRQQNEIGKRLAHEIVEFGVACLVDLNK